MDGRQCMRPRQRNRNKRRLNSEMKVHWMLILLVFTGCSNTKNPDRGQELVDLAIASHRADYVGKRMSFIFRDRKYAVERSDNGYRYSRSWQDDSLGYVEDLLINSTQFFRIVDKDSVVVSDKWEQKYRESINSVLYFFQIPYVLNDPSAVKTYEGLVEIEGRQYEAVRVTFQKEKGGEDFNDVFMYWISKDTRRIDYVAYSYLREGGGARFRVAMNQRMINGMLFQDYINYAAPKNISLEKLPELYVNEQLQQLSVIVNDSIRVEPLIP